MTEDSAGGPFDRVTRTSAAVVLICSALVFFLFAFLGDPAKGRAAAICTAMILFAGWVRWDLRRRVWFWITISFVVFLHIPLVLHVPWTNNNYPGIVLLPFALVDFSIVYGCIKLVEKAMRMVMPVV